VSANQEGFYEGSSKAEEPNLEPALKYAILNAYKKGMGAKSEEERLLPDGTHKTFQFRVEDIFIEGKNPPTDYRVYLSDHT
jgi:hypothetical protein